MHYAIFDTHASLLQWAGSAGSDAAAVKAYFDVIGRTYEDHEDLSIAIVEVSTDELAALEEWNRNGGIESDFPPPLDVIRRLDNDQVRHFLSKR